MCELMVMVWEEFSPFKAPWGQETMYNAENTLLDDIEYKIKLAVCRTVVQLWFEHRADIEQQLVCFIGQRATSPQ